MRFFTESCFRAAFIAATVINSEIMFVYLTLIVLTKGTKGIALWSTKIFLQNLRYKHMNTKIPKYQNTKTKNQKYQKHQNTKIPKTPKYKLPYMRNFFSVISQKNI